MGPFNLTGEMLAGPRRIPDIEPNGENPMSDPTADEFLAKCVRHQRTIVLALLGGPTMMVIAFTVLHFVVFDGKPLAPTLPNLTLLAAAVAGGAFASSFIVPDAIRKQTVERRAATKPATPAEDASALLLGWQTIILVRTAMFEGAAVLSAILFLLTADFAALGIAIVMIGMIAMGLPSEATARRWLDGSLDELERKRGGATDSI